MAFSDQSLSLFWVLCMALAAAVSPHSKRHMHYSPPNVTRLTDLFPRISVPQGFSTFFGAPNAKFLNNGSSFTLALDKSSGAGLASKNRYYYGFFSAAIKLPAGLSSGVVVAFYMSNADKNPHNHDEIDIELLGHERRNDWVIQTNVYANGSVRTGREEKFYLWFDPTQEHHYYSILWNAHHIVFLVDNIPVREFKQNPKAYPTKPMSVYATIWDGSEWATNGGKYPVNYKYGPFVVSFSEVEISGCIVTSTGSCLKSGPSSSSNTDPIEGQGFAALSEDQRVAMDWARRKLMFYSYCKDTSRFKVMPPECN